VAVPNEVLEPEALRLLSVDQVSALTGLKRSTIYALVRAGKLRKAPLSGVEKTRFRLSDVAAFVNGDA
jgi:excisionase family DNA binding protein